MPVLVIGAEKNFAALRSRLFSGRVSSAATKRVVDALRLANPHVDLDALRPGTVLTVPDLPEVSVRAELSLDEATSQGIDMLVSAAVASLGELLATAKSRLSEGAAEQKQLLKSIQAREVQAAAAEDQALAADVEATRQAVEAEAARTKDRASAIKRAGTEWTSELKALRSILP